MSSAQVSELAAQPVTELARTADAHPWNRARRSVCAGLHGHNRKNGAFDTAQGVCPSARWMCFVERRAHSGGHDRDIRYRRGLKESTRVSINSTARRRWRWYIAVWAIAAPPMAEFTRKNVARTDRLSAFVAEVSSARCLDSSRAVFP